MSGIVAVFVIVVTVLGFARHAAAQDTPDIKWMRGGHSHRILRIVYSTDGTFFATAATDRTIKIWRASDAMLLRTIFVPVGSSALALSPDNATICAGGHFADAHPFIRCWQVSDGVELWTAAVPNSNAGDDINNLSYSPDGQRIVTGTGGKLKIFRASDGGFLSDYSGVCANCYGGVGVYSPDGNFIGTSTAFDYARLALLDASNGSLSWDFGASSVSFPYDVAFSPDSQLVGSANGIGIHVFGTYDHAGRSFDRACTSGLQRIAFSPNGTRVAGGGSGYFCLWNTSTGALVRSWTHDNNATGSYDNPVAFSPDSTKLLTGTLDLARWNASTGNFDALLTGQTSPVWLLAMSANEQIVATMTNQGAAVDDHVISLFRTSDGALLRYIDVGAAAVGALALSPDGQHVVATDRNGLRVWNTATGALEHTHAVNDNSSFSLPAAYTVDGSAIAFSGDDRSRIIALWNPATDTVSPIAAESASLLKFLPDGRLAAVHPVPTTYITDVDIFTLAGHRDQHITGLATIASLAVSPDGTMIAAGGADGTYSPAYVARIWRVSDGTTLQTLVGHTNTVMGLDFARDSQTLVSGAKDATVRVWRTSDGTQLRMYDTETYITSQQWSGSYPGVWSLVASPRSGLFVYGRGDATIVTATNPEAQPAIMTFTVPARTTGSCKPASAKVVLDRPAPPAGITVSLASNSALASVPATLTIKAGATSKSFKITTTAVNALQTASISATLGSHTETRDIGIRPIGVKAITLSSNPVTGGTPVTGTVKLECNAAPGDIVVGFSTNKPLVAQPTPTITIPQGSSTGAFTITTSPVSSTAKATIGASTNPDAVSTTKKLTVNP
jgi:WD40 repeat protein